MILHLTKKGVRWYIGKDREVERRRRGNVQRKKTEKDKKVWISTLIQMVAIVVIVLLLRTFVIGTIYVKGSSMEPNFHHGDFLVINKLETRVASPQVNDIVICKLDNVEYQENIIKRVIGLPGDEIDLRNNGSGIYHLYINGTLVEEPYIAEPMQDKGDITYPFVVPEDCYFVMGDNRNASTDSRRQSIGAMKKRISWAGWYCVCILSVILAW